ncbi:hypothetical protein TPHA_0J00980 [Tetrapisispora phaffii CBS 4417]|uniref:Uncharacterized protein n=1 Tax=Tetrapisispora phaffii (strain ATCC 24235 / CBS 4417 / NBRC 1672 / NRRL Y-8282 / UCD 70-5) TaxID=1071381 RepID=G8BYH8_TETPH|nr:hypothetical protein TPHA_0J00980 [Tetrapisispora phaffii CBS 4417]CCE64920.1 hypothetical protein TPHA_0J00980 [Tetrapisispora phaffii CBS 4417]
MPQTTNIEKVSDLLKDDISLEKISGIKEQLIKEKSTLEYQLSKKSDHYYGLVEEGLNLLDISQESVKVVRQSLNDVNKLSTENRSSISRYDVIFNSTKAYEFIDMTASIYDKIIQYGELTKEIERLIEEELDQDPVETGCPYLLQIHYMLSQARDFEDQMTVMADVSSDDAKRTVQKLFQKNEVLVKKFDKLLGGLIVDIIEIVRSENSSLAIRVFKVVDLEEKEDLKIIALRNIIMQQAIELNSSKSKKLPNSVQTSKFSLDKITDKDYQLKKAIYDELLNGSISGRTNVRNYKSFVFDTIRQSIQNIFIEVRREYQGERRFEVLENLDWVFNELLLVKDHLSKYCPEYLNIFDIYFEFYYDELNVLINELVESEPETIFILDILDFDRTFKKVLISDFGFDKNDVKTIIGDEQKERLFADYLNLLVTKMQEWISNLIKAEFDIFSERSTPPHTDSEGLLYLDGTKTCFQMFTQQVEVASGSNQSKILVGVIEKFCGLLQTRQKDWNVEIQTEVKKLIKYNQLYNIDPHNIPSEYDCPGGLVEYLTAVANDQMRAADYAVAISNKYGELVSKVYEKSITNHIESTLDGFAEVAKRASMGIITIMFDDLTKPYEEIFGKTWYNGSQAQQISDTLVEYLTDLKTQMNPFVFTTLVESVVEETILEFVGSLKYEHSFKNKNNKFLECMKRDFEIFYKLFIQFIPDTEDKAIIIDEKFKLMEFFMDFSCSPADEILNTWNKCLAEYWDTPVEMLQAILKCRKDIDNSKRKQLVLEASRIFADPERVSQMVNNGVPPTFISRLVLT